MSLRSRVEKLERHTPAEYHRPLIVFQREGETREEARRRLEAEKAAWNGPPQFPAILVLAMEKSDEHPRQN